MGRSAPSLSWCLGSAFSEDVFCGCTDFARGTYETVCFGREEAVS